MRPRVYVPWPLLLLLFLLALPVLVAGALLWIVWQLAVGAALLVRAARR